MLFQINQMTIQVKTLADLEEAANTFLAYIANKNKLEKGALNRRHFVFYGEMGVGKTTFIKAICRQLGIADEVSSPTYALVNEYQSASQNTDLKAYHLDLYRLKNLAEAIDIGIEEYLDEKKAYCFIEWPQVIESLLGTDIVSVYLSLEKNNQRAIKIA